MANGKVSPEVSQSIIETETQIIKDIAQKVKPFAEEIATALGYAQEFAKQTHTEVDDRIVVFARAFCLLIAGGAEKIINEM